MMVCGYHATFIWQFSNDGNFTGMSSSESAEREQGSAFLPRFDANGLLTAIAMDSSGKALAQGRNLGPLPQDRGDPCRLRPGRSGDAGQAGRPGLPHGRAELLLSPAGQGEAGKTGHLG